MFTKDAFLLSDTKLGKRIDCKRFERLIIEEIGVQTAAFRVQALFKAISKDEEPVDRILPSQLRAFLDKAAASRIVKHSTKNIWRVPRHHTHELKSFDCPNPEVNNALQLFNLAQILSALLLFPCTYSGD